jgi:hypothetical protein
MKLIYISLVAIMLAGCLSNPRLRYAHPDAGYEQFADVSYQCERANNRVIANAVVNAYGEVSSEKRAVDCDKFNACMAKKGFTRAPKGEFVLRKDVKLNCTE